MKYCRLQVVEQYNMAGSKSDGKTGLVAKWCYRFEANEWHNRLRSLLDMLFMKTQI